MVMTPSVAHKKRPREQQHSEAANSSAHSLRRADGAEASDLASDSNRDDLLAYRRSVSRPATLSQWRQQCWAIAITIGVCAADMPIPMYVSTSKTDRQTKITRKCNVNAAAGKISLL
ncbi:unnamed protein product [Ceratitis capitata]|uniref:(Mediterranean fruit fly) hypothetical protein n=1 Tax=Ceratitis capitata TaxID=7213 RepID=A0A811VEV8_CERCA|nr:unnamed protein product [Ceratitis capitata]